MVASGYTCPQLSAEQAFAPEEWQTAYVIWKIPDTKNGGGAKPLTSADHKRKKPVAPLNDLNTPDSR